MFPSHVARTVDETGALKAPEEALLLRVLLAQLHEAPIEHLRAPLTLADRPQGPEKLDSFVVPSRLAGADGGVHPLPGLVLARRQRSQVPLVSSCLGVLSPGLLLRPALSSKARSLLAVSPRRVLELGH